MEKKFTWLLQFKRHPEDEVYSEIAVDRTVDEIELMRNQFDNEELEPLVTEDFTVHTPKEYYKNGEMTIVFAGSVEPV